MGCRIEKEVVCMCVCLYACIGGCVDVCEVGVCV